MTREINTDSEVIGKCYYKQLDLSLKPSGLWYGINGDWLDWCRYEMPEWIEKYNYQIEIDESKILQIDNIYNLRLFIEKYACNKLRYINWQLVSRKYSGIEIINYHEIKYKNRYLDIWFYSWDCDSGCIWDIDVIKNIKKHTRWQKK
jgi:hypothetical protein